MKAFENFWRFVRFGLTFGLLLTVSFISRAQITGGPVGPPIKPFSVDIVAPTNGADFPVGANITITAVARDYGAFVNTMSLYANGKLLIGRVIDPIYPLPTNGEPVTLPYNWTNVPAGAYTLTAVAGNTMGQSVTSSPVNITVGPMPPPSPIVTIVATDPIASMMPGDTGTFTVYRTGNTSNALNVFYSIGGTASNGVDYVTLSNLVSIPAGAASAQITVTPIKDPLPDPNETVVLQLTPSPLGNPLPGYQIGFPSNAIVTILGTNSHPPFVSIIATDPIAVEPGTNRILYPLMATSFTNYFSGTNTATFLVRRCDAAAIGATNSDLIVYYNIGGTASNGVDYVALPGFVTIPAGKTYALITINPLEDVDPSNSPPYSTVILSLTVPPTVTNVPPPYLLGWPDKAGAIIFEERLYPWGPPIGPVGPPIVGGPLPVSAFHVALPGANGMNYCLQVSTNLIDWIPVCTNTVVKGSIQFLDPDACSFTNRYYRAVPATALPVY